MLNPTTMYLVSGLLALATAAAMNVTRREYLKVRRDRRVSRLIRGSVLCNDGRR